MWAVVADANRYFAGEEPWAKKKTDLKRMETILYVTAEVVRQVAILAAPVMPTAAGKLLDLLGQGRTMRARSRRWARRGAACPARPCPRRQGVFPRYVEPGLSDDAGGQGAVGQTEAEGGEEESRDARRSPLPPGFPAASPQDLEALLARAREAGVGMIVTISTRIRQLPELTPSPRRYPNVYCSVGTHPHNAHEELDIPVEEIVRLSAHPEGGGDRRGGPRLLLQALDARGAGGGLPPPHRGGAETGLPLEIHTRDADDDTRAILEEEHAKGPFPAILHCYTGGRGAGAARA